MRMKLDENLGRRCVDLFAAAGHDVATVQEQGLCSAADVDVIAACRQAGNPFPPLSPRRMPFTMPRP